MSVEKIYTKNNIVLTISYDGTNFCGWQKQQKYGVESARTVQGEIEKALAKIHKGSTDIFGSGRTDSGVHARAQIANFYSPYTRMQPENYVQALNSLLPSDVRIMKAKYVFDSFHARFFSQARTYRYFCECAPEITAWQTRYSWHIRRTPHLALLNDMASVLQGELDCTTFSASGDESKSKFRYIENAHFFFQDSVLVFEITANAFLYRMVRSILGTLLDLEKKMGTPADFFKVLTACNRSLAGPTAPPQGLFLWDVLADTGNR